MKNSAPFLQNSTLWVTHEKVRRRETALNSNNIGDEVCFPVPFKAGNRGGVGGGAAGDGAL